MKRGKRSPARRAAPARGARAAARPEEAPRGAGLAEIALWLLVVLPPLFIVPSARESFRLPKLMLAEWLGLASLVGLALRLRGVEAVRWADLPGMPALRAAAPLLLVALVGLGITRHPLHARQATIDLAIGAACLVGWSLGLPAARLERALELTLWPAAVLALLGILQFHGAYRPLQFLGTAAGSRLGVTSLAGNPGDLAGFLALPCLIAQWRLPRVAGGARWWSGVALALSVYCLAATQTFSALAAAALGSAVLWGMRLQGRWRLAAVGAVAGAAAVAALLALVLPPLRARVAAKTMQVRAGEWNGALSGRLDGWRAASYLLAEHPLAGVGQGAFRAEFAPAKLALMERGVPFYPDQPNAYFANAHNEILEVGADLGWPGLAALAWGIGMLWAALRRLRAGDGEGGDYSALAWAGTAGLAVLSLAQFPFRIALVAFPALLFLAWVFRAGSESELEVPA